MIDILCLLCYFKNSRRKEQRRISAAAAPSKYLRSSAIGAAGRRLSMIRNFYLAAGEFSSVCFRIRKILVFLDI